MVNAGYTSFLHKIDISMGVKLCLSPSPQSKGRFYEITDVGLANMLNLTWKYVEKEKKKENLVFF